MRTAAIFFIMTLSMSALFAQTGEHLPQLSAAGEFGASGGGIPATPPLEAKEELWTTAMDVLTTTSSITWISFTAWPQDIAHLTSFSLTSSDLPNALRASSVTLLTALKHGVIGIHDGLREFVHWAALPLYYFRHLLESAPTPNVPWAGY